VLLLLPLLLLRTIGQDAQPGQLVELSCQEGAAAVSHPRKATLLLLAGLWLLLLHSNLLPEGHPASSHTRCLDVIEMLTGSSLHTASCQPRVV